MFSESKKQKLERKPLILNAFVMGCSGHQSPGLWKHPKDQSKNYNSLEYWVNLAKLLEEGKFDAVFIADVLGGYDVYNGPANINAAATSGAQWPVNEPSYPVTAMAAATKNLSFAVTFSTITEHPYHFARRLATLDHLTNGRIGWNIVSSYLDSAARNLLNGEKLPPHDERYARAEEYLQVVYELLLSSWRDDAIELDSSKGVYSNPDKIREINFEGRFFKVPGPAITEPTPQRIPVIMQAGTSKAGKEYAAKNAEATFINSPNPEDLKTKIDSVKKLATEKFGREEDSIKFIELMTVIIGKTHEESEEKYNEYKQYGDLEGAQALFGGWTGIDLAQFDKDAVLTEVSSNASLSAVNTWTKVAPGDPQNMKKTREYVANHITVGGLGPVLYGTAEEVADEIERWVDISEVDGFNFAYAISPGSFEEIVNDLLPELRKRKLARTDYPKDGLTFRENLFGTKGEEPSYVRKSHPAYNLRWRSEVSKEDFENNLSDIKDKKKK